MTLSNSARDQPARDLSSEIADVEGEIEELQRQVGNIPSAGTDFAIRLDRRSTTLVAAIEEVRAAAQVASTSGGRGLPRDFWSRTAAAITSLTAIRAAARAALG